MPIASYWPSRLLARRIGHVVYAPGISHPFEVDQPRDRAAIFVCGKGDYDKSPVRGRLQCLAAADGASTCARLTGVHMTSAIKKAKARFAITLDAPAMRERSLIRSIHRTR